VNREALVSSGRPEMGNPGSCSPTFRTRRITNECNGRSAPRPSNRRAAWRRSVYAWRNFYGADRR